MTACSSSTIPVRCDQIRSATVDRHVRRRRSQPPGRHVRSTERRPRGPAIVVDTWGPALVAFAWQCVLGLISGLAGAIGKDTRGNVLVPAELEATPDGLAHPADGPPPVLGVDRLAPTT